MHTITAYFDNKQIIVSLLSLLGISGICVYRDRSIIWRTYSYEHPQLIAAFPYRICSMQCSGGPNSDAARSVPWSEAHYLSISGKWNAVGRVNAIHRYSRRITLCKFPHNTWWTCIHFVSGPSLPSTFSTNYKKKTIKYSNFK